MYNTGNENRIGGSSLTIGDCQIWVTINYLDSATDYREYLPKNQPQIPNLQEPELAMLDDCAAFFNSKEFRLIKRLVGGLVFGGPVAFLIIRVVMLHIWQ